MMVRKAEWLFFLFVCIIVFVVPSGSWAQNEILNIRHWVAPDHTRFVIDTSRESNFKVEKAEQRVTIILEDASLPSHLSGLQVYNKPGLNAVFLFASPPSSVAIELSMPRLLQANVFKLKKFRDKPDRIVVDIILPEAEQQERKSREEAKLKKIERVVVIDPGHGGDDPGAVGMKGLYEKDVVLDISRKLRDILNKKVGYRAFLTRDGDYYVPFKKRLMIAREYGADLFLSVHADASRNRTARGSSVYCISSGAASSEAARILANNENLADVIGGVPAGEENGVSDPIILDMFQNHVINQSRSFGRLLLKELQAVNSLKFDDVQKAPFYVLRLPEITSVLLETAFVSNPEEEKLLKKENFQKKIALAVANSIERFFPPLPKSDGKQDRVSSARTIYTIKNGDTLSSIARKYGTTAGVLRELNGLKRPDILYVGSKLIIPVNKQ
jgi:N-acetylmuramoyl-L-alanine amidase